MGWPATFKGVEVSHRFRSYALLTAFATGVAGAAQAQTIPEGQSCGGLLCDMGLFGHKTPPTPPAPATTPLPSAAALPSSERRAEPDKPRMRKKKRVARTKPAAVAATKPPGVAAATPARASAPAAATPPAGEGAAIRDPLTSPQPARFRFQPIY